MRNFTSLFIVGLVLFAGCESDDPTDSLQKSTYYLHRANYNPVSGKVTVTELSPGKLEFHIVLENTQEGIEHPAHLHFGSVSEVGDLAYRLNPVDGSTGESYTVLDNEVLTTGDTLTYSRFLEMDGSIKVHMNEDYFKHMVLAFGNVGKNEDYLFDGVAVCTGH